jgi:hypothetical protein
MRCVQWEYRDFRPPGDGDGITKSMTALGQKEASRRRAQRATLDELARSYNVSRPTISRLAASQTSI